MKFKKLILLLFLSGIAHAKPVKIAYYYGPPQSFTNEKGEASGIVNTKSKTILNNLKIDHIFHLRPIKRIYNELSLGTIDIFNCGLREVDGVARGKKNIALIDVGLFSKKGIKQYTELKNVKNKKIVTIRGASMGGATKILKESNSVIELTDPTQLFNFTEKGRADFVLVFKKPGELFLKKLKLKEYNFNSMIKTYCRWMVSKKYRGYQELIDKLDAHTPELKESQF